MDSIDKDKVFISINVVCFLLSLLGIVFSIMWIKLGKASKAWYEVYESAIGAIEKHKDFASEKAIEVGAFCYNRLDGYKEIKISNSVFSGKAGEFSPSKINIGIGQVFLVTWLIIGFVHSLIAGYSFHELYPDTFGDTLISVFGFVILFLTTLIMGSPMIFKSGTIDWFRTYRKPD
ncbi:hypothetical protein N7U62_15435 [Reichenbachiella sp. ABR2-5]|uniref:DUF3592 domain-containing protein n=1 Tax=Reichenbachiella ulvae TaxID=2980104 RepID=A0ABT3CWZ1_9BACT|nr:hypothetical protein [Reichenbachiella ulvae]MCV9388073.1 hypothetical protein [Reichenbachiella ulvae]